MTLCKPSLTWRIVSGGAGASHLTTLTPSQVLMLNQLYYESKRNQNDFIKSSWPRSSISKTARELRKKGLLAKESFELRFADESIARSYIAISKDSRIFPQEIEIRRGNTQELEVTNMGGGISEMKLPPVKYYQTSGQITMFPPYSQESEFPDALICAESGNPVIRIWPIEGQNIRRKFTLRMQG